MGAILVFSHLRDSLIKNIEGCLENIYIVFREMLLGYQHTPDLFHSILREIPSLFKAIPPQVKKKQAVFLQTLSSTLYSMMFRHSGYPNLYKPIVECLKEENLVFSLFTCLLFLGFFFLTFLFLYFSLASFSFPLARSPQKKLKWQRNFSKKAGLSSRGFPV